MILLALLAFFGGYWILRLAVWALNRALSRLVESTPRRTFPSPAPSQGHPWPRQAMPMRVCVGKRTVDDARVLVAARPQNVRMN